MVRNRPTPPESIKEHAPEDFSGSFPEKIRIKIADYVSSTEKQNAAFFALRPSRTMPNIGWHVHPHAEVFSNFLHRLPKKSAENSRHVIPKMNPDRDKDRPQSLHQPSRGIPLDADGLVKHGSPNDVSVNAKVFSG